MRAGLAALVLVWPTVAILRAVAFGSQECQAPALPQFTHVLVAFVGATACAFTAQLPSDSTRRSVRICLLAIALLMVSWAVTGFVWLNSVELDCSS